MHYTISIALRRGNETVAGALYNPVADEMFTAIHGRGAFLNGERLGVSAQTDVGLMAIGTGLPSRALHSSRLYRRLDAIRAPDRGRPHRRQRRQFLCLCRMGRLTGYFEEIGAARHGGRRAAGRGGGRHRHRLVGPGAGGL